MLGKIIYFRSVLVIWSGKKQVFYLARQVVVVVITVPGHKALTKCEIQSENVQNLKPSHDPSALHHPLTVAVCRSIIKAGEHLLEDFLAIWDLEPDYIQLCEINYKGWVEVFLK